NFWILVKPSFISRCFRSLLLLLLLLTSKFEIMQMIIKVAECNIPKECARKLCEQGVRHEFLFLLLLLLSFSPSQVGWVVGFTLCRLTIVASHSLTHSLTP